MGSTGLEFFILDETYTDFAEAIAIDNLTDVRACPKCGSRFVTRLSDLSVKFVGKKKADYYSVSNYSIISKKFLQILRDADITGFSIRDISVQGWYDSKGIELNIDASDLKELVVGGRGGYLRKKDGTLVEKCNECGAKDYKKQNEVNGLGINLDEWDKSDIFYFDNWEGVIIVTEELKGIIETANLKNIKFTNIRDFSFD